MPVKKLPKKLVKRLEKAAPVIERYLGRMKNIDCRLDAKLYNKGINIFETDPERKEKARRHLISTYEWGGRVREMNISRNFPRAKLAIKRVHSGHSSSRELEIIKTAVEESNKRNSRSNYKWAPPIAYPISDWLIAMVKTRMPTLPEIIDTDSINSAGVKIRPTKRGIGFFKKIKEKNSVDEKQLFEAAKKACKSIGFHPSNVLLLGFENGKIYFHAVG